ncbi:hypothetical protein HMPREF1987_01027 [Peptostreptococcaceae bacterium oral taxon 113 str. W5053]|nr:hypothetical protein HMPREF1987_01027 [Peptostreptococcaceae bacterium oral taxon 113 str. W5053]
MIDFYESKDVETGCRNSEMIAWRIYVLSCKRVGISTEDYIK